MDENVAAPLTSGWDTVAWPAGRINIASGGPAATSGGVGREGKELGEPRISREEGCRHTS